MSMKQAGGFVLNLLFPRRCPFCDRVVGFATQCACAGEVGKVKLAAGLVEAPRLEQLRLGHVWACYAYEEPVRGALHRLKFEDEPELAEPFGRALADRYEGCGLAGRYDLIVPVPASGESLRERGYNQSALLANELSARVGVSCDEEAVSKITDTLPQHTLDRKQRLGNLTDAFAAKPEHVAGKRVLLVDDIITTGSTLNECASALGTAGAKITDALCVAATGFEDNPAKR